MYQEYCYNVKHRNQICQSNEINSHITIANNLNTELYASYYTFDSNVVISGFNNYEGNYYLNKIILDIDKGKNSDEQVLINAKTFYSKLSNLIPKESIRICFSGTGYHFEIPNVYKFQPSNLLPRIVNATLTKEFPEVDAIFYGRSLIRVINTINKKSNLYKINLTEEELLTLTPTEIHTLAKTPREIFDKPNIEIDLSDRIVKEKAVINNPVNLTNPTDVVTCMQVLYNRKEIIGRRHKDILRLTSWLKRQSIPLVGTIEMMKNFAPSFKTNEIVSTVTDIYDKPYSYSCKDEVMKEFCDSRCIFFRRKNYNMDIPTINNIESSFVDFINNDNNIFDLNKVLSIGNYKFYKGELVIFLGDTGIGKTAIVQNIITKLNHIRTLYLSFEVGKHLLFRRFIQIAHNMTKDEVITYYKQNSNTLSKELSNLYILDEALSLEQIENIITKINPQIIVIDTIDGIISPINDMNAKLEKIGVSLKEMAIRTNTVIFGIHHISKNAAKDIFGKPARITKHSGKYASAIEQKADKVIGIEIIYDEEYKETDNRHIVSLKSRDEHPFETQNKLNFNTFKLEPIIQ